MYAVLTGAIYCIRSVGNVSEKLKLKINDVSKAIETLIRDLKRIHRAHESLVSTVIERVRHPISFWLARLR